MEKSKITRMNTKIKYSIKESRRARRIRLAVHCDGSVVATVPTGVAAATVQKFIDEKIDWVLKKVNFFKTQDFSLARAYSKAHYLKHKTTTRTLVEERIEYFNAGNEFSFNRVCIRNQKTRWGSCSQKRNLNFNYKIIFLPQKLQDYIVVHELCHLKEFNHSCKFWALVESILPDYAESRKALKKQALFYR